MSSTALAAGLRRLRGQLAVKQHNDESDENLLQTFLSRRDEAAFAVLMRRHGPMVLHVCRRVLGHEQDAEDAFQATFLVLARNAVALRNKASLASFLHSIAYRTALKARQSAARRRKHEGQAPPRSPDDPVDALSWREVRSLLDEEIAHLPEVYRGVFVLCSLEGVSREEAARRLNLKEGTVSSRLTAARKRLGQRLARRGVELTAVLAVSTLAAQSTSALPVGLMARTIEAALATVTGEGPTVVVSASVVPLVQGATTATMVSKVKVAAVVLLAVTLLGGAGLGWNNGFRLLSGGRQPPETTGARGADAPRSVKHEPAKNVEIHGRVFGPDDKPMAGARLLVLGESGKIQKLGTTSADGRFVAAIPKAEKSGYLLAQAEGAGIDFLSLAKGAPSKPIEFHLVKDQPIRGRVINTEGKPVAGVNVAVSSINIYSDNSLDSFLTVWKKRHYMSGVPGGEKHLWMDAAVLLPATADAEGRFILHGVGKERFVSLRLSGAGIAEENAWIINRDGFDPKPYNQATLDNTPKGRERESAYWMLHGPEVSIVAESEKPIHGIVRDGDNGKGRPGVVVRLTRINRGELVAPVVEAKTDAMGHYEIHGARKVRRYMLEVAADTTAGYMPCQVWADDTAGYQPIQADIKVKKGVIITGKIRDGGTGKPIPGFAMADALQNNPFAKDYPSFDNAAAFPMRRTEADGTFHVVAIPGPVILMGGPGDAQTRTQFKSRAPDPKYPQYFSKDPRFVAYYRFGGGMSMIQGNYCKVLEIKPDARIVEQDIVLERASVLPVRIQDTDGKPLSGCLIAGLSSEDWHYPIRCDKAECSVYELEAGKPRLVVFFHPTRRLTGALTLSGDEKAPVVAKLVSPGALKGRLLDADGKPLAGVAIDVHYRQRVAAEVHNEIFRAKQIVTDAQGAFAVENLIPEQKFELYFHRGKRKFERTPKRANPALEVKSGECLDWGAIEVRLVPE